MGEISPIRPLGLDPLIWGFLASLLASGFGTYAGPPNSRPVLQKFFGEAIALPESEAYRNNR